MSTRKNELINKMIEIEKDETLHPSKQFFEKYKLFSILLADEGWYFCYNFAPKTLSNLYLSQIIDNSAKLDTYMIDYYKKQLNRMIKDFKLKYKDRFIILKKAFKAHKSGDYELSIPVFLTQIEGLFFDLTNAKIFSTNKSFKEEPAKTWVESKKGVIDDLRLAILESIKENQNISSNITNSKKFPKVLNRNEILHGRCINYSNEINSFKAISLLLFIGTIVYDIESNSKSLS